MSVVSVMKKPFTDFLKSVALIKEGNNITKTYEDGDITSLSYKRKRTENRIDLSISSIPILTTLASVVLFGSHQAYDAYTDGIPLLDFVNNHFETVGQIFSEAYKNNDKDLSFIELLKNMSAEKLSDYASYIGNGTKEFFKNLGGIYLNTTYVAAVATVYGLSNMMTSAADFLMNDTRYLNNVRDYDTEKLKLDILRQHYHDPVFDSLNNEELFLIMTTTNKTLHNYHMGNKKIVKNIIQFIDKCGNDIVKPFRKFFNKSTNDKDSLINSVYNHLENGINFTNPDLTYEKYNVKSNDFKIAAEVNGGVTRKDMINYIFNTNNKAMVNAYKMKLKDDTILAFSLKLESIARTGVVDASTIEDMRGFSDFISGYQKNKSYLQSAKLPDDLKEMVSIIRQFTQNTSYSIQRIQMDSRNKDYTSFLERNAPHLINRSQDGLKIEINNYSFLSYYEAEKERVVKSDINKIKIAHYTEAKNAASERMDRTNYKKFQDKIALLEFESFKYSSVFGKRRLESSIIPENLIPNETKKISSIFTTKNQEQNAVETFLVNHLLDSENKLVQGSGLKEKGLDLEEAKALKSLNNDIKESSQESRTSFKKSGIKFQ